MGDVEVQGGKLLGSLCPQHLLGCRQPQLRRRQSPWVGRTGVSGVSVTCQGEELWSSPSKEAFEQLTVSSRFEGLCSSPEWMGKLLLAGHGTFSLYTGQGFFGKILFP